ISDRAAAMRPARLPARMLEDAMCWIRIAMFSGGRARRGPIPAVRAVPLDDHLLRDIGLTRADIVYAMLAPPSARAPRHGETPDPPSFRRRQRADAAPA